MPFEQGQAGKFTVKAYRGDAKTLLAFNLPDRKSATNLAGFTIRCRPGDGPSYFLHNTLRFRTPGKHTQDDSEPANSSLNSPIHKFRWLHVPGSVHQGTKPFFGPYTYTVTPRFFDDQRSLLPLDQTRSASVTIEVAPFRKGRLALGFARGFTQSQAFVHHFGLKASIKPKAAPLVFDTTQVSGKNAAGEEYTFRDEYEWLGFTARERLFEILAEVRADENLRLDVFAYDLNEPDFVQALVDLGASRTVRVILDDASLHHASDGSKPEDKFEKLFAKAAGKGAIKRGRFGRYAHDKVLVVSDATGPVKVLTGSTNFSVTGIYVNSNHVLVFDDRTVAATYADVFEQAWKDDVAAPPFRASPLAQQTFTVATAEVPSTAITFSPHTAADATRVLQGIASRIAAEQNAPGGSVLFAVMELQTGTGPVLNTLKTLHQAQKIFTYGITDSTKGIALYASGQKTGVLVTGKPGPNQLPPPFDQVPGVGLGHQVHHKFVVCGFNGDDPVVYCGSSNLALGGEQENGDNLIAIRDADVATVFAIEAVGLVDHFEFLDRRATGSEKPAPSQKQKFASKKQEAVAAGWFLSETDRWVNPYFDPKDLHCMDRLLFA